MSGSRTRPVSDAEKTAAMARASSQRVGDADRDRVAEQLAEATADGLLQLDEMDERLTQVFAARTAGELTAVTADLPEARLRERRRLAAAGREAVRPGGSSQRTCAGTSSE